VAQLQKLLPIVAWKRNTAVVFGAVGALGVAGPSWVTITCEYKTHNYTLEYIGI
jgi:hypothetical protein